jgi:SAM-dependent methyltransferase
MTQPELAYFDVMAAHARTHWWYEGRRRLVSTVLARAGDADGRGDRGTLLDVGCGTGDNIPMLQAAWSGVVVATDLSEYALRHARAGVAVARAEQLPFPDEAVGALTSMDVVEHLDDDLAGLAEYHRVLGPGGLLLLTVPAYQWLWSAHDDRAAHRRRYTRGRLARVVDRAGFDVSRSTYFNSFLVPPAVLLRRTPLRRFGAETDEEVGASSSVVTSVMTMLGAAERRWTRRRKVPFGLSILLLARRR